MKAISTSVAYLVTASMLILASLSTARAETVQVPDLTGLSLGQAMKALPRNMSIGGDEVGSKPPIEEKSFKIFFQNPPPGTAVEKNREVRIAVKRYGSWDSGVVPDPTPTPGPGTGGGSGNGTGSDSGTGSEFDALLGVWEGRARMSGGKPQKMRVEVTWSNGTYYVAIDNSEACAATVKNGKLVGEVGEGWPMKYVLTSAADDELDVELTVETGVETSAPETTHTRLKRVK